MYVGAMDDHGVIRTIAGQYFSLELTPEVFLFLVEKKVCPVCVGAMDDHGVIRTIADQNFSLELTPEAFLFLLEKESLPCVCGSHGRPWYNPDDCGSIF